jgi:von Willebrand factor type A domain-containing protein
MPIWPIGSRGRGKPAGKDLAGDEESEHQRNPERPGATQLPVLELRDGQSVTLQPGKVVTVARPMADICIVFDTTGSMSGKIQGLIDCMSGFADDLAELSLDWRLSVLPFGDLTVPGDRIDAGLPFVASVAEARSQLREMPRFSGGGNAGESSIEALLSAIAKPWRPKAVRVVVLLTDEPALGAERADEVLGRLNSAEIICFVASPRHGYYRSWAAETGGHWVQISQSMDTNDILRLLRGLVKDVAKAASDVHAIAGGSYRKYLELTTGG